MVSVHRSKILRHPSVTGKGLYVTGEGGRLDSFPHLKHLCDHTLVTESSNSCLVTWIACTWGHAWILQNSSLCVLVALFPRLLCSCQHLYGDGEKRDLGASASLLSVLVGSGIAAGICTGATALVKTDQTLQAIATLWFLFSSLRKVYLSLRTVRGLNG
jgi:hypothetical protein